ncbi:unnamed protein product [Orchesella dallaii]|uniref:DOMON domain-containing protein n=1 Tax=Orchesella dallaii TaxID=48710 RepID=A0ABP1S212_9HEXA
MAHNSEIIFPILRNWNSYNIIKISVVILCMNSVLAQAAKQIKLSDNPYYHKEILGVKGNYILEWFVDWESKSVTFNVSAGCKGYVGLGLSKKGTVFGSDFFIGGVDSAGKPYFSDMHGILNETLERDSKQDWKLLNANRTEGKVHLSFSRSFETCDEEDIIINEDLINLIWAYGDTDETTHFQPHLGTFPVYLLDPDLTTKLANQVYREIGPHSSTVGMQRWRAATRQIIPASSSSQICTIIKGPSLGIRHYIVGGGAYLPFDESQKHVRQIILTRCTVPNNVDSKTYFEPFVKKKGEDCYFLDAPLLPKRLCTEMVFVSGYGEKAFYLPENIGIPIGDSPNEYYMLEIHYHNPENLGGLEIKAGLDLMFHPRPKEYNAGILTVSYGRNGLFTIPPRSPAFSIYGHCSSNCTNSIFKAEGLNVFAVMLQMRDLGKGIRLRHFRGNAELPWIQKDDNYNNTFQQIRWLPKEVTILPGDQLTIQCTYDSLSIFNTTTFSGYSSNDEHCLAYLFVNQVVTNAWCSSEYSSHIQLQRFGVQNITWDVVTHERIVTSAIPKSFVGEPLSDITDRSAHARWSPNVRAALQREMLYGQQSSSCPTRKMLIASAKKGSTNNGQPYASSTPPLETPLSISTVSLPSISHEYRPISECQRVAVNNFGYRNILRSSYKSNTKSKSKKVIVSTSTLSPDPPVSTAVSVKRGFESSKSSSVSRAQG